MSGSLKIIKRRIKSAKNIGQITKAMEMVAAAKMKKAENKALAGKPYSEKIYQIVTGLMENAEAKFNPLLWRPKEDNRPLIILISTNRGLCGALNLNLFKKLNNFLLNEGKNKNITFITLGKKGLSFIVQLNYSCLADFSDIIPFTQAVSPIISTATNQFISQQNTSVFLVYNDFINALQQTPKIKKILPLGKIENKEEKEEKVKLVSKTDFLIEPSKQEIINFLLPFYLEAQVREAILEAEASEFSARMMAMKNATDNANELVGGLTLEYNKLRQQAITTEIADIVTARISMEKK